MQAEYEYKYQGQQTIRRLTQTGQTIHNVYDQWGQRIAEYLYDDVAHSSSLIREYIWANGMLVGVVEAGQLYLVRSDHIGRPVFATDTNGSVVWEATYLPFGGVNISSGPNSDLRNKKGRIDVRPFPKMTAELAHHFVFHQANDSCQDGTTTCAA